MFTLQQDEPGTALVAIVLASDQGGWGNALAPGSAISSKNIPTLLHTQQASGSFQDIHIPDQHLQKTASHKHTSLCTRTSIGLRLQCTQENW